MDYEEKYRQLMKLCLDFSKAIMEINNTETYEKLVRKIAKEKGLEDYVDEALKNEQGTYKTKYEK